MKKRQNQREALKMDKSNLGILIVNVAAENCDRQNLDNLIMWAIVETSKCHNLEQTWIHQRNACTPHKIPLKLLSLEY